MGAGADARRAPTVTEPTTPAWLEPVDPTPEEAAAARAMLDARPAVQAAMAEARASRADFEEELERLEAAGRAAIDIKAKVKRNPVRTAGVAAGVGFLAVGGPKKLFRGGRNLIFGKPDPLPKAMLPDEIEKAVRALGGDGDKVRGALERNFAAYLEQSASERKGRDLRSTLAFLVLPSARVLILRFGRQFIERVLSSESDFEAQLAKVRARRAGERENAGGSTGQEPPSA